MTDFTVTITLKVTDHVSKRSPRPVLSVVSTLSLAAKTTKS
jgi:hypothetical protein